MQRSSLIRQRKTASCGCEIASSLIARQTTHGLSKAPEYAVWKTMIDRCHKAEHKSYARYGGRGIQVCERWHNFENFWIDMCPRPFPEAEIDRRDNSGNYEPLNCRWVTREENGNNKRNNHFIEFDGFVA